MVQTKEQKAVSQKRYYEKNKAAFLERKRQVIIGVREYVVALKESTPCADCGQSYPSYVMDFDHLSDKEYTISKMIQDGYSLTTVKKEINKCDIVCSNCHRIRTHNRKSGTYISIGREVDS